MKDMKPKQKQKWLETAIESIAGGLFGKAYKAKKKHKKKLERT
jgi:hypothetical protein